MVRIHGGPSGYCRKELGSRSLGISTIRSYERYHWGRSWEDTIVHISENYTTQGSPGSTSNEHQTSYKRETALNIN